MSNFERQLLAAADNHSDWDQVRASLAGSEPQGVHLAIMNEPYLEYLLNGAKTIESRFSRNKVAPFGKVAIGDLVLLKNGPVVASFKISSVEFVTLNHAEMARLQRDYSDAICADDQFWEDRSDKNYATLMGVSDVTQLTPVSIDKKDRRAWVVIRDSDPMGAPKQGELPWSE